MKRANKTLKNVRGVWVKDQEIIVEDNGATLTYRAHLKVTFLLDE